MNIVLIGSGNVAHHLGIAFLKTGHRIVQVYSRNPTHADTLAETIQGKPIANIHDLDQAADLYILAISDDALPAIVSAMPETLDGIVVHTSGATDMNLLSKFKKHGVVYPPQSISKEVETDLSAVPFGIEANSPFVLKLLMGIMENIAPASFPCTSKQRLSIHVAAVFANNFPNALFQIAQGILEEQDLPFDLIRPIIAATAQKVQNHFPREVQTGPAVRNDLNTIHKHLEYLKQHQDWQTIYQLISTFISKK